MNRIKVKTQSFFTYNQEDQEGDKEKQSYYNNNNELHRIDGPAIIREYGYIQEWYFNDKLHRENGPAVEHFIVKQQTYYYHFDRYEFNNGALEWWIHGEQIDIKKHILKKPPRDEHKKLELLNELLFVKGWLYKRWLKEHDIKFYKKYEMLFL